MTEQANMTNVLDEFGLEDGGLDALLGEDQQNAGQAKAPRDLALFRNIPVRLTLEVDSIDIALGDLLQLSQGEVLPLDKQAGAPMDVRVNGTLLAKAEVVVVDGKYGLRLTEVMDGLSLSSLSGHA
ncbi:flagellar motor switch protein FliN [Gallaecimonas xiamenensis]|uniref:Flagellar motor switch protein FliN n=1 Tax=Gallaecimonas xiamenensis 3-C-1 TaxID=745411 RepID=K2IUH6_9GAMM|nr:flagellar motor switch protein FliN [Gallaecimonas xiamenensis]EKE73956.1 lateral flagellar motor switch protein, lfiN [Gallaecimonas xiamenensis 3-C-1]